MRTSLASFWAAACSAVCCVATPCQTVPPPIDPALRARFGFLGPDIHKMDWGIGLLRVAKLDGERWPAVAVVNNGRRARLELLRSKGKDQTEGTEGEIQGLAVADVDADGIPDLLMLTGRGRLVTRLRGNTDARIAPIDVGVGAVYDALRAGDLDGDGKADALVLTNAGLRRVTKIASAPALSAGDPVLSAKVRSLHLCDADGDGHLDVLLGTSEETMAVRLKRGQGDGSFGPWIMLDIHKLKAVFPGTGVGGRPTLAAIEGLHGRVVEYVLQHSEEAGKRSVELTTLAETKARAVQPFAHGDIDGDGDLDLVLADPERARLTFLVEESGAFKVRTAPSLSGIDSVTLGDLDADGVVDLLLASAEERTLAYKSGAAAMDAFPTRIPTPEQPLAAAYHEGSILCLSRDDRNTGALWRIPRQADGKWGKPQSLRAVGRLRDKPRELIVADLDGQHGPEVCYVRQGKGLHVLFASADGTYTPAGDAKDDGAVVMKVDDGEVSLTEHEGRPALFVVRGRFARTLRFGPDRQPVVLAQDNGPEGIAELTRGVQLTGGARAYLDNKTSKAWITQPDRAAVSVDVPRYGATHMLAHRGAVLLLAKTGVVRIPHRGHSWNLKALRTHEPPTTKTRYYGGVAADLDGDGHKDLAIADSHIHGMHVLVATSDELKRGLSFPVFEVTERSRFGNEPRGFAAGDLDGDGRHDLALVCHDRVLIYRQEK